MKPQSITALLCLLLLAATGASAQDRPAVVELQTNLGTIAVQLDYAKAPVTADNFVAYVSSGFYKNTLIHRAVANFVIQGGGYSKIDGKLKATNPPIVNEASNGLANLTGTIAMARTTLPNTATSQFFFNLVDNPNLNYGSVANPDGYAVFGSVIHGMPVVSTIGALPTYSSLPYTGSATIVWIEAVYTNLVWDETISKTRIMKIGSGTVKSVPAGINCGASCGIRRAVGEPLSLTATPAAGFVFGGWRGDCRGMRRTINLDTTTGNHNCTAVFTALGATNQ